MEWRLVPEAVPYVSTFEFHQHRDRARHLEEEWSQPRLLKAEEFLRECASEASTWSDLGCGDGGLLSRVQDAFTEAWGYDFSPANAEGWPERGVKAEALDVFGRDRKKVRLGGVASATEVLEHLADPHGSLRWIRSRSRYLVCSSPWNERPGNHSPEHAWAWDLQGYIDLVESSGWTILRHEEASLFQVILARA